MKGITIIFFILIFGTQISYFVLFFYFLVAGIWALGVGVAIAVIRGKLSKISSQSELGTYNML